MLCPRIISTVFFLCVSFYSYAQDPEFLLLPKGSALASVTWRDSIYRFPSFQEGKITFATGFTPDGEVLLNYNLYFMRMELIEASGDTAGVMPSRDVKQITIGERIFKFYESGLIAQPGFMEVMIDGPIGLGVINYLKNENREYWPYKTVTDIRGKPAVLDRYYSKAQTLYFFDSRMKLRPVDKPNLIALMRDYKKEVERYIVDHQINFDEKDDVVNIVNFCNDLRTRK